MTNSFFKTFDKKRFLLVSKLIFILACLILIINLVGRSYTRYESTVDLSAQANIAFFIVEQGTYESSISLKDLVPSDQSKYYRFYVANYKNNRRADTDLDYTIKFETTTNLPLTYELVRNDDFNGTYENIIDSNTSRQDDYGVFYNTYTDNSVYSFNHNRNEVDSYMLKVTFDSSYKNRPDDYQGKIELFSIIINATQKLG